MPMSLTTIIVLLGTLLHICASGNASQPLKPEKLVGISKDFVAEYVVDEKQKLIVRGIASFSISRIKSSELINGSLTISLSETSRNGIASLTGKPVSDIAEILTYKNVAALLKNDALCPFLSIYLENPSLKILDHEMIIGNSPFYIDLRSNSEELKNLLCQWAKSIKNGRSHTYRLANRITAILQGKTDDQQK